MTRAVVNRVTAQSKKEQMRLRLIQKRQAIQCALRQKKAHAIQNRIGKLQAFQKSSVIAFYAAKACEVDLKPLILESLKAGKTVCLPRVMPRKQELEFRRIISFSRDLRKGFKGILEPVVSKTQKVLPERIDFICAPGVGFTLKGDRLGYGGGYFDRFLKKTTVAFKAGIAFREQVVPSIPTVATDIQMDQVVHDGGIK